MTMQAYLAGAINGCTDKECKSWRDEAKALTIQHCLGIQLVDPMRRDYRGQEGDTYREIVELDKLDVRSCDFVIVMYEKPSAGTSMEILYAWENQIPVVLIDMSGKPMSPWIRYHTTRIEPTLLDALLWITEVCE